MYKYIYVIICLFIKYSYIYLFIYLFIYYLFIYLFLPTLFLLLQEVHPNISQWKPCRFLILSW